jgi:hypothetical protein
MVISHRQQRTLTFMTMTTKPILRAALKVGVGGNTAIYMARWASTGGERGPWSELAIATVAV